MTKTGVLNPSFKLNSFPFLFIAIIILLRIIFIGAMGPMPQDAYYFFYSQHPDLSYFDHPPAIAYLLKLFTTIFGKNVFAIKLADSLLTWGTVFLFYKLSLAFHQKEGAVKSLLLLLSTLMVSILSLVSTPDTPLLFFWTLSLIFLHQAIFKQQKWYWIWAGIAMGLAFDSKYPAVFLPAGMILFLLLSKSNRHYLAKVWPWLACVIMVVVAAPVIIWNLEHNFASFAFQSSSRMHDAADFNLNPILFFGLIGHQMAVLIPVLFIAIFWALSKMIKQYKLQWESLPAPQLFLLCFFLPVFLLFLFLSPVYWIKINWMMPAYISGIIWVTYYFKSKWLNWQIAFSLLVHLALAVQVFFYPVPIRSDDTWYGWKELSTQVKKIKDQHQANFVFSDDGYKTSAELNLYSNYFIYGQNVIGERALQFDYIGTDLNLLKGKNAIYVNSEPGFDNTGMGPGIPMEVAPYFNTITQLKPVIIERNGVAVRKFLIYLCKGYKPSIVARW